jgi:hypothetical protein
MRQKAAKKAAPARTRVRRLSAEFRGNAAQNLGRRIGLLSFAGLRQREMNPLSVAHKKRLKTSNGFRAIRYFSLITGFNI